MTAPEAADPAGIPEAGPGPAPSSPQRPGKAAAGAHPANAAASARPGKSPARACRAHVETWRPYTLAYPGLVGLTGAALSSGEPGADGAVTAGRLLVAWAAPTLGWISGHYLGDWFDRALDAIAKPQRPLPSGRLSPRVALACGVGCAAAAAVAAAAVNWRTVLLVAVAMLGIVAYSRLLKGRGLTGNAVRGALTATTVVFGAMTVTDLPPWQVLVFAAVFAAQDTASNLVGTLRDVEGDRSGGCRTVPVRHGVRAAVRTAASLYAAALATAVSGLLVATAEPGSALALLLCAAVCGAGAFVPLLRDSGRNTGTDGSGGSGGTGGTGAPAAPSLTPERALRAHEFLVAQRLLLAGAVLAAGWTLLPAVAVVLPLLVLSLYAQARMRSRHEFPGTDAERSASMTLRMAEVRRAAPHDLRGDVSSC